MHMVWNTERSCTKHSHPAQLLTTAKCHRAAVDLATSAGQLYWVTTKCRIHKDLCRRCTNSIANLCADKCSIACVVQVTLQSSSSCLIVLPCSRLLTDISWGSKYLTASLPSATDCRNKQQAGKHHIAVQVMCSRYRITADANSDTISMDVYRKHVLHQLCGSAGQNANVRLQQTSRCPMLRGTFC